MYKTSSTGRQLIEQYEGLILGAYDDATDHVVKPGQGVRGTLTIGYGHTTAAGPPTVVVGQRITKDQADQILSNDLRAVENDVTRMVKVPINQNQFDALVSFHFNTGSLGKSTILRKLNAGDTTGAAAGFDLYTRGRVGGKLVPMAGLVRRRKDEKALFLKPSSLGAEHGAATGAIVAGTAVATQYPHLSFYLIGGSIVLAIVLYEIIKHFKTSSSSLTTQKGK